MKISIEEALIKTASVEIRTLMVSGRQVTLALFRQLDVRQVVDAQTLTLRGPVWGRVNYHGAGCNPTDGAHAHLVWQDGADLCHSIVMQETWRPCWGQYAEQAQQSARKHLAKSLLSGFYWPGAERGTVSICKLQGLDLSVTLDFDDPLRGANYECCDYAQETEPPTYVLTGDQQESWYERRERRHQEVCARILKEFPTLASGGL